MVSYTFKWQKRTDNEEVYVTGTFDNWTKSVKLSQDEKDEKFLSGTAELSPNDKILYKFVVNNDWIADTNAPTENDDSGIQNNVLYPEQIVAASTAEMSNPSDGAALPLTENPDDKVTTQPVAERPPADNVFIQSAAPQSSTAQLAAKVPLEKTQAESNNEGGILGQANEFLTNVVPQATTAALAGLVGLEKKDDNAGSPTPDVSGGPGGFPQTPAQEQKEHTFSVSPLPASKTADNPITLSPGEEVPKVGTDSVNDNVKHDEDSYKASDSSNFGTATVGISPFPASQTAENPVRLAAGEPIPEEFKPAPVGAQSVTSNVTLDEESYNKPDSANLGVGPAAYTLPDVVTPAEEREKSGRSLIPGVEAYTKPAHSDVPSAVQDSIKKSDWEPEATSNSEAVAEKKEVEAELLKTVESHTKPPAAAGVPEVVAKSLAEFNTSPEAAANPMAVEEKKDVEKQLLEKVNSHESSKAASSVPQVVRDSLVKAEEPAEAAASAEAVQAKEQVESALVAEIPKKNTSDVASDVPEVVKDSLSKAHASPEAALSSDAVDKKIEVEEELKNGGPKDGLKHVETKSSAVLPSPEHTNGASNGHTNGHANGANGNGKSSAASSKASSSPSRSTDDRSKKEEDAKKKERRSSRWFHKLVHAFAGKH